jgi:hypothetical protein
MVSTSRLFLAFGILLYLLGCSTPRDPVLSGMETAIRAELGTAHRVRVGYLRDSTGLLIDFDAAALPDTQAATFARMARTVAGTAVHRYPKAATLEVSAGEFFGTGSFRVSRQRIFTAAELR